jgi:Phosphatidylinositol transfer protein
MVIRASAENTKGGEGVVWLKNEPYDNTDGHMGVSEISGTAVPRTKGQYTLKEYHLASRVPGIVRTLLPSSSMVLVEEAWNAYPHCKTVLVNAYLDKHKFKIDIESLHLPDNGTTHNALNLTYGVPVSPMVSHWSRGARVCGVQ